MPVEVIKYTCQFRCRKKAIGDKSTMAAHEHKCWKNPENKTCNTCKNQIYDYEYEGNTKSFYRLCKLKELSNMLESAHEVMSHQNSMNVRPLYNCPYWGKEADENIGDFAEKLHAEIAGEEEGTHHYPFYNKPRKEINTSEIF